MKKLLLSIIILVLAVSCQETEFTPVTDVEDDCLYCTMESISATKTSMDENNNVLWSEGDQLVAFMKSSLGSKYQIKDECVGSTNGGFSKVTEESSGDDLESGGEISHNVVLYPYTPTSCMKNDNNEPANSYKVNLNLPETQTYAVGSFGNGSFPMIAVSSSNKLLFKNICGGVKLQFKGEDKIKSIKLESIGGEKISGKATVIGYADGTAPATTMADGAASSVTLDCGDGVQLSDEPKTFIISVPPVVFESGMKITVTDTDGISRELTNESKNTVKRSSLLTFPVITYTQTGVFELAEGLLTTYDVKAEGGTIEIPVVTNQDYQVVIPENAAEWITVLETKVLREETIALNVTENTNPESRSAEVLIATTENVTLKTITINQEAGEQPVILLDYIDEYGVNHGKGTMIDGVVWAPVNCGYHATDYKYGKLYQWGRKYGQGYYGAFWYDLDGNIPVGTYSDASVPDFVEGPVSLSIGQSKDNENKCYYISGDSHDWCDSHNDKLWNSGTEASPVKTAYDPCPDGWRVPTYAELNMLNNDSPNRATDNHGRYGYWVSGSSSYTSASQIFLPAAGYRSGYKSSSFSYDGSAGNRPLDGVYWSSKPDSMPVSFRNSNLICGNGRANGYSVRCVQNDLSSDVPEVPSDPQDGDYVDEYGINHGQGVEIDGVVWAPVNCGYHETDFRYGKLYQWGRKYGQGYDGPIYDVNGNQSGTYSDVCAPSIVTEPVSLSVGQSYSNSNKFYTTSSSYYYDWVTPQNNTLWNSGTDTNPIKTEYDPCPEGWRVPTYAELNKLKVNHSSWTTNAGQNGIWFSGLTSYSESVSRVFFPTAGSRGNSDGSADNRGVRGLYHSSSPSGNRARGFDIYFGAVNMYDGSMRVNGYSVRCVKE